MKMMTIVVRRLIRVAVILLLIFGNFVISQKQQQQQQSGATIKVDNSTTITTTTTTSTSSSSSSAASASPSSSIKNLTPSSTTTTKHTIINNKNTSEIENKSREISIKDESGNVTAVDVNAAGAANDDVVGASAVDPAIPAQILSTFDDVGPSSITPTTYRPLRSSAATQTSAQDRERMLMNVLAARRTALHRGTYRSRIGTTGRTASTSIETTPRTPTDPRSICIRNCTKNFTRRTTASCMRQCASFHRTAAAANGTSIVVKASSKTGSGTQQRERDTNEILFTDESSHGLFVVAKELNGTANHITEGAGMKSTGGYKFKSRKKPPPAVAVVTVAPPTSFEEDDIAPYLFFGQKLPPIRPAMLSITAVSNDHPKLLEVSVVSTTPATVLSTLSAVERSRSRYKYNMRDRGNLPFNRRFNGGSQGEQRRNPMTSIGGVLTTSKPASVTLNEAPMATTTPKVKSMATTIKKAAKPGSGEVKNMPMVRRAQEVLEELQQPKLIPKQMAAIESVPSTSTPLIITVLSNEDEGVTELPQVIKSKDIPMASAARPAAISAVKKSVEMDIALLPNRIPDASSTTSTTTKSTVKPNTKNTSKRTTTTTTAVPTTASSLSTTSTPPKAPTLPTSHVLSLSTSPPMLPSLSPFTPKVTTSGTASLPTKTPMTSITLPKSIIEEDTKRLRALGPSLTQEISTDEKTNLIIFVNKTSDVYESPKNHQNNSNDNPSNGFPPFQPTRSPTRFRPNTEPQPTVLHTTVLTSVRSTVNSRPSLPRAAAEDPPANEIPTTVSTAAIGSDISSTVVTDDREVAMEIRRINMATYVLIAIGILPLIAVIVYVMRNYILRRNIKTDDAFDVCITDQQPISPVKKLDSKYRHDDDDDEDEVDLHHNHHPDQHQQKHAHHNHHRVQHTAVYRQKSIHQQKQPQQRDANFNIHCSNTINSNNSGRYDEQCSVTSDQEFDRNNIRLKSLLGEGNFGQVWKAEADDLSGHFGATRIVAVKTVRACSAQVGLKEEANIMRKLGCHQNVVTLLGACVESEPHMLIMEYAMRGRLLSLLRAARNATNILPASVPGGRSLTPLSPRTLTGFALDIACGMEYIAERRIVHRDLAARNVLLDHNGICKICDFGMSLDLDLERQPKTLQKMQKQKQKEEEANNCVNDIMRSNSNKFKFDFGGRFIINPWSPSLGVNSNINSSNAKTKGNQQEHKECNEKKSPRHMNHDTISRRPALPIRWMAPEALQYHVFTTETDIWAFGIVLWEIATLGSTPYSHLTGREVIRSVPNGLRPDIPKEGRHEFYNVMSRCWHKEPQLRPSFTQARLEISRSLGKWVEDDSATSDYMDVSGFSEDMEHGMVYFNHRISEFECEI